LILETETSIFFRVLTSKLFEDTRPKWARGHIGTLRDRVHFVQ